MRIIFFSVFIIILDQCSKLIVKGVSIPFLGIKFSGMSYGTSYPVIGDFIRLTYIENAGMAFGFDIGGKHFFGIVSILASIFIIIYMFKMRNSNFSFRFSLALILGGACGNLIDRVFYGVLFDYGPLFYGRVVDFMDIDFFNIQILGYNLNRWPIFNVADASVTIGVILLLIFHNKAVAPTTAKNNIDTADTQI